MRISSIIKNAMKVNFMRKLSNQYKNHYHHPQSDFTYGATSTPPLLFVKQTLFLNMFMQSKSLLGIGRLVNLPNTIYKTYLIDLLRTRDPQPLRPL